MGARPDDAGRPERAWHHRPDLSLRPLRPRWSTARYSRFVGVMKVVLPTIALLLVCMVAVWPYLEPDDFRFRIGFSKLDLTDAGDPSAINPRFLGTDKQNQIYSVTADLAKNLVQEAGTIELEMPKADILLKDGAWVVVTAETGLVNRGSETLELTDGVTVYHDKGYEFLTSRAMVYLNDRVVTSDQPVQGQGPFGRTSSEGIQVVDKGEVVFLTGRSKVVLYPNAAAAQR